MFDIFVAKQQRFELGEYGQKHAEGCKLLQVNPRKGLNYFKNIEQVLTIIFYTI